MKKRHYCINNNPVLEGRSSDNFSETNTGVSKITTLESALSHWASQYRPFGTTTGSVSVSDSTLGGFIVTEEGKQYNLDSIIYTPTDIDISLLTSDNINPHNAIHIKIWVGNERNSTFEWGGDQCSLVEQSQPIKSCTEIEDPNLDGVKYKIYLTGIRKEDINKIKGFVNGVLGCNTFIANTNESEEIRELLIVTVDSLEKANEYANKIRTISKLDKYGIEVRQLTGEGESTDTGKVNFKTSDGKCKEVPDDEYNEQYKRWLKEIDWWTTKVLNCARTIDELIHSAPSEETGLTISERNDIRKELGLLIGGATKANDIEPIISIDDSDNEKISVANNEEYETNKLKPYEELATFISQLDISSEVELEEIGTNPISGLSPTINTCAAAADCFNKVMARKPCLSSPIPEDIITQANSKGPEASTPETACKQPTKETWGVRFRYKKGDKNYNCQHQNNVIDPNAVSYEWFLTLLPAMRSVIPLSGGLDTPNAMPGLQFQVKSNVAKHRIPGFQPIYQHMGVDTVLVTLVGTFTGDGGLGYMKRDIMQTPKVEQNKDEEGNYQALPQQKAIQRQEITSYEPWDQRPNKVSPIFNPITQGTHNRAYNNRLMPSEGSLYRWDNKGSKRKYEGPTHYMGGIAEGEEALTWQDARRSGMFQRDGCPWSCEDEYSGEGRQPSNQGNADVTYSHTLLELASYLDSYHEFASFYKLAIQDSNELEVEVNMRKNRDHMTPMANKFLKYGRDATGMNNSDDPMKGPLRNSETGNPSFKGIVRNMEVYHSRSDRTWYTIQMELTDYGLIGEEAINLTSNLEQNAMEALNESLNAREVKQKDKSVSKDCLDKLNEGNKQPRVLITLPTRGFTNLDKRALVVDNGTGLIYEAYKQNGEWNYKTAMQPKEGLYALMHENTTFLLENRPRSQAIGRYVKNYLKVSYVDTSKETVNKALKDTNKDNYITYHEDFAPYQRHKPTGLVVKLPDKLRAADEVVSFLSGSWNINPIPDLEDFLLNNRNLSIEIDSSKLSDGDPCDSDFKSSKADTDKLTVNESDIVPQSRTPVLSNQLVRPIP